ncbi:hypothetical protein PILCRDRAFT_828902 [Piloderma croceum F 1598]|uniref:Uncharacterized protein n=1 Tax=Piloderma croceum (strain F 1598) TaxID=765440 RepID=A0A0C3AIN1_PILCF|nr:hypothetical protein PILCRDRAFT_828902 [Piloderma croceum F 1598]
MRKIKPPKQRMEEVSSICGVHVKRNPEISEERYTSILSWCIAPGHSSRSHLLGKHRGGSR